jgi:hypothetical protein
MPTMEHSTERAVRQLPVAAGVSPAPAAKPPLHLNEARCARRAGEGARLHWCSVISFT